MLENILRGANANALLLRPDRYVLAYLGQPGRAADASVRQLLSKFSAQANSMARAATLSVNHPGDKP